MILGKGKLLFFTQFYIIILRLISRDIDTVSNSLYDRMSSSCETETGKHGLIEII